MSQSSQSGLPGPVSLGGVLTQIRLVWRLLRDGRVPGWIKLIPLAGLIYLISPIDLLPDFMLPGLAELDDLAVILLSLKAFVNLSPPGIVREHVESLLGKGKGGQARPAPSDEPFIDVPYRVVGSEDEEGRV